MRRQFLFKLFGASASLFAFRFGRKNTAAASRPVQEIGLEGLWHLIRENEDETEIPRHRMDMVFKRDGHGLRGTIVNRNTGAEMPLIERLNYDGTTLSLKMKDPSGSKPASELPTLVMTRTGDKFEGFWMISETETTGPKLKLVKAK